MSSNVTSFASLREKYASISNAAEDRKSSPKPAQKRATKAKTVDIGLALGAPIVFTEGEKDSYQAVYSSASGSQTGDQIAQTPTISIGGVRQDGQQYVRNTFPLETAVALAEAILTAAEVHPVFMEGRKVFRRFKGKGKDRELASETVVEGVQSTSAPTKKAAPKPTQNGSHKWVCICGFKGKANPGSSAYNKHLDRDGHGIADGQKVATKVSEDASGSDAVDQLADLVLARVMEKLQQ